MKRTGSQILWECLVREGVTDVFGYPGGAILPAYDAMLDFPIRHILVRHEQGATHMADGYARASGRVGVAIATSGPGATNMVTGIATAMMDSSPIVCITGQVGSRLIGSDAFQETDITGITLPITKHNYLVTRAEDVARTVREAFAVAASGRPGPVLIDITKDAQQASCEFEWEKSAAPNARHVGVPRATIADADRRAALELIHSARRPVILAGHGILLSGAMPFVRELAERAGIPVAMTLLGIGAFPASHPLNLGMMGMHGEAWVNTAIQEADLLIALGMRFDDRVTGNVRTYARQAKKIHIDVDAAEIGKIVPVDVGIVGDLCDVLGSLVPGVEAGQREEWIARIDSLKGDSAVRDIQNLADDGHLYAAHVMSDLWRATNGRAVVVDRRRPAPDVGSAVLPSRLSAHAHHVGRPRHDGLCAAGGDWRQGLAARRRGLDHRRRRRLPDDDAGAGDDQAGRARRQDCRHQQRLPRAWSGSGRSSSTSGATRRRLCSARTSRRLPRRTACRAFTVKTRGEVVPAIEAARAHQGTVLIDFQVEQEDTVYPMVPAGADLHAMIRRPSALVETAMDEG